MKLKIILTILVVTIFSATASADDVCVSAENSFKEAVKIYVDEGSEAFMERVLKNGPLEGDKRSLSQVQGLSQIEQFYGNIQSGSVISKKQLGAKTCYLVGVLEYAKGPTFAVATYYLGKNSMGGTSMFFKTEPGAIIPRQLLVQEKLNN